MDDNLKFETYLYIGPKKLIILTNTKSKKKIYEKELKLDESLVHYDLSKLDYFLNENIFKIEKLLNSFVKKIFVIIDLDQFLTVEISVKKKNFENFINSQSLHLLLNEAKECCKKTIEDRKIIHMIINSYKINNEHYSFLPKDINAKNISLDIKFICLPKSLIRNLEQSLKKLQISIDELLCAKYIKNYSEKDNIDFFDMANKIILGHNKNEVKIVNKKIKNKGFFEKFFDFFS